MPHPHPSHDLTIPALCHHSASGRAVCRLNGKDHYCGAWDAQKNRPSPDARAVYQRLVAEYLATAGGTADDEISTVAELATAFLPIAQRDHASKAGKFRTALRYLMLYADLPIDQFGPRKLQAVRTAMIRDGLARATINAQINRIRLAFRWAGENELIDPLQHDRLAVVRPLRRGQGGIEPVRRTPVPWDQVAAIERHVAPAVWAMVQLQWHTGMRSGEVIRMRGREIDTSGEVWLYRPSQHKTDHLDHVRIVAIGPQARAVLTPWLRADPDEYLFQPMEAEHHRNSQRREARQTPPWPSHDPDHRRRRRGTRRRRRPPRDHYTPNTYRQAIQRAIKKAGVTSWTPHQLRHTFATRARGAFEEWDPVRAALGHTSPQATMTYARLDEKKAVQVAERIG